MPPLGPTGNTHAPDRMTGFNPGPWNPHPGLSIWCVPGSGLQLTKLYPLRKTCGSTGGKTDRTGLFLVDTGSNGLAWDWHATTPPSYLFSCHLMAMQLISNNLRVIEIYLSPLCMQHDIHRGAQDHAMQLLKENMPKHSSYKSSSMLAWFGVVGA